jgi:nanoRNase/pAp phosphatase (c-di-AMP/oligoRNAs hydrolase)
LRGYTSLVKQVRKAKAILIVGHQNSDPDAICSAYAFLTLAQKINRRVKVTFTSPGGVSKLSKQILGVVPLEVTEAPNFAEFDVIVTVDTNTLQQLGGLREAVERSGLPIIMIDHHAPHPENAKTAALVLCNEKSTSTCEIILDMYEKMRFALDRRVSQALLIGVLVETGHMSIATKRTFNSTHSLIEKGADPQSALSLIRTTMDDSERIARVKTVQRAHLEKVGKWLIALSEVGSYHASAARGLVALGAHLAVVAGKRNDELTVSFRATHEFVAETGIHLGTDLASPLGVRMGGMGGGHSTAAGANAKGNAQDALRLVLMLIRELMSQAPKNNTQIKSYPEVSSQTGVITQN